MSRRSKKRDRAPSENSFQDLFREALQPIRQNSPVVVRPLKRPTSTGDRRFWAPAGEPARDVAGRQARIVNKATAPLVRRGPGGKPLRSTRSNFVSKPVELFRFADARKTIICLKRKVRRSVMFAFKQTGKGARTHKKRNQYSNIRCT